MCNDPDSRKRVTYCKIVEMMAFKFSPRATKNMIQSLFTLAADRVPMVKIACAKTIGSLLRSSKLPTVPIFSSNIQNVKDSFLVSLKTLMEDRDSEVAGTADREIHNTNI